MKKDKMKFSSLSLTKRLLWMLVCHRAQIRLGIKIWGMTSSINSVSDSICPCLSNSQLLHLPGSNFSLSTCNKNTIEWLESNNGMKSDRTSSENTKWLITHRYISQLSSSSSISFSTKSTKEPPSMGRKATTTSSKEKRRYFHYFTRSL